MRAYYCAYPSENISSSPGPQMDRDTESIQQVTRGYYSSMCTIIESRDGLSSPQISSLVQSCTEAGAVGIHENDGRSFATSAVSATLQRSFFDSKVSAKGRSTPYTSASITPQNGPRYFSPVASTSMASSEALADINDLSQGIGYNDGAYGTATAQPEDGPFFFSKQQYESELFGFEGMPLNRGGDQIAEPNSSPACTQRCYSDPGLDDIASSRHSVELQTKLEEVSRRLNKQGQLFMRRERELLTIIEKLRLKVLVKDREVHAIRSELLSTEDELQRTRHGYNLLQTFCNEDKHFFQEYTISFFFALEETSRRERMAQESSWRNKIYYEQAKAYARLQYRCELSSKWHNQFEQCSVPIEAESSLFRDLSNSHSRPSKDNDKVNRAPSHAGPEKTSVVRCRSKLLSEMANEKKQLLLQLSEERGFTAEMRNEIHRLVWAELSLHEEAERAGIERDAADAYLSLALVFFIGVRPGRNWILRRIHPRRMLGCFSQDILGDSVDCFHASETPQKGAGDGDSAVSTYGGKAPSPARAAAGASASTRGTLHALGPNSADDGTFSLFQQQLASSCGVQKDLLEAVAQLKEEVREQGNALREYISSLQTSY
ncbi:unnamed protein product [Phytomonas sp. EM1]|nr:unnamed protein product [Phytomonas sp. EM1]|eukprot:CCW63453.1 unnamed protein product [Phytomonas sp. isolate EM1]